VISSTGSSQKQYDIFGHSAGGQILHRFALLFPDSKANRILASNAGSYTLPDFKTNFPYGLKDLRIETSQLKESFQKNLVVFLGEEDNENETGGLILRSPTLDKQGTHRFSRGNYFYNKSKAKKINTVFNWKLYVVSGVGHNQKEMAKAAALYLYE
jgi:pimeloyl-ACP methyl ester carboxylesterase